MKRIIITGVILLAGFAEQAVAVCPSIRGYVQLSAPNITALLTPPNTYACGRNATNTETWNEYLVGSDVWDYKEGPGHAIDPSEKLGTWSIDRFGNLTYNYTAGSYTYTVWGIPPFAAPPASPKPLPANFIFCGTTGTELTIKVSNNTVCTPP